MGRRAWPPRGPPTLCAIRRRPQRAIRQRINVGYGRFAASSMSQIFRKSANAVARMTLIGAATLAATAGLIVLVLMRSSWATSQHEYVEQPIQFSHRGQRPGRHAPNDEVGDAVGPVLQGSRRTLAVHPGELLQAFAGSKILAG